jgi:hypothetical protein
MRARAGSRVWLTSLRHRLSLKIRRPLRAPGGVCTHAAYGAASGDRVYKSMFYGSKHIDQYVPKTDPNPNLDLMTAKQSEWAKQHPQALPTNPVDMYKTTSLAHSTAYKGEKYGVSRLGGM